MSVATMVLADSVCPKNGDTVKSSRGEICLLSLDPQYIISMIGAQRYTKHLIAKDSLGRKPQLDITRSDCARLTGREATIWLSHEIQ